MNLSILKKSIPIILLFLFYALFVYASGGETGHGEGHATNWKDFMWRTINFAALIILLWYLLADKIKKYFVDRKHEIAQELEDVDKEKIAAEQKLDLYKQKFQQLERDIQEIRDSLIGEIESEKDRIIEEAKVNSQRIIEQANASAKLEAENAKQELRNSVIELAGEMAVSIVTKNIDSKDQERLVQEYLDRVERKN